MTHTLIHEIFTNMFDLGSIDVWWPNGYNSIRVRYTNKKELVFTYYNDKDWKLETIDKFIKTMMNK